MIAPEDPPVARACGEALRGGRLNEGPGAESPCCGSEPLIRVEGLSVDYGDKTVLEGVSLDIRRGCVTAVVGPSGCGKTSFLNTLNRLTDLLPCCRVRGSVMFGGVNVLAPSTQVVALRRRVGMIFQKPNPFPLSIRRNLDLPLAEHAVGKRERRDALIENAFRDVGLWAEVRDRLEAPAQALSGGQQQRLCIARALALNPDVLLLDEPCSALDPIAGGVIEGLVRKLRGRLTLVLVTHDLGQARRLADDVAFFGMRDGVGRMVECGTNREIFETSRNPLTRAYLDGERASAVFA